MSEGSAAIGRTVRAGLAGWALGVRACAAALVVAFALCLPPLGPGLAVLGPLKTVLAVTLASGALYRAIFAGPSGWNGLRWGREEWRLLAVLALSAVILAVVGAVLLVVVGAVSLGVVRTAQPDLDTMSIDAWRGALSGPGGMLATLVSLLSIGLMAWLFLRLSLGPAATTGAGKVQVLSAFERTRGAVPSLAIAGLVLAAPALILGAVLDSALSLAGGPRSPFALRLVNLALLFFYFIPVWTAALVDVYRHHVPPVRLPGSARP